MIPIINFRSCEGWGLQVDGVHLFFGLQNMSKCDCLWEIRGKAYAYNFVPQLAFYLLTLRTGIPVLRACWLSSQRDTERGQNEQRSFVLGECGHETFGRSMVCEASQSCFLRATSHWLQTFTFNAKTQGWPYRPCVGFYRASRPTPQQHGVSVRTYLSPKMCTE